MRKTATNLTGKFALLFFAATVTFFSCNNNHESFSEEEEFEKEGGDMYNEAAKAQQFEFERTKDPVLGYVPKERLAAAYQATERSKQIAIRSRIASVTWTERGPTSDEVGMNNGNIRDGWAMVTSGRMKTIWVDL